MGANMGANGGKLKNNGGKWGQMGASVFLPI